MEPIVFVDSLDSKLPMLDERNKYRSKVKRRALKELICYIARRLEMYDYPWRCTYVCYIIDKFWNRRYVRGTY